MILDVQPQGDHKSKITLRPRAGQLAADMLAQLEHDPGPAGIRLLIARDVGQIRHVLAGSVRIRRGSAGAPRDGWRQQ